MTVLVTGATGFIGSHVAEALLARGERVRCLCRPTSDRKWLAGTPVEWVTGSLDDVASLEPAVRGATAVYHVAGVTKTADAAGYDRGNRAATENLLTAVERWAPGVRRFLHVSSLAAAGPSPDGKPVTEEMPCSPVSSYGHSKLAAENAVLAAAARLPVTIVRPPVVYGPRDKDVFTFFKFVRTGFMPVVGDRKEVSIVHCADLTRGILAAAESDRAAGRVYYLADPRAYDWEALGRAIGKSVGRSAPTLVRVPEFAVRPLAAAVEDIASLFGKLPAINREKATEALQACWVCSPARAREELGFEAKFDADSGMADTAAWYVREKWL